MNAPAFIAKTTAFGIRGLRTKACQRPVARDSRPKWIGVYSQPFIQQGRNLSLFALSNQFFFTFLPFFYFFLDLGVDKRRERGDISKETGRFAEKRLKKRLRCGWIC